MERYPWIDKLWPEATRKLAKGFVQIDDPSPVGAGGWGMAFAATYMPWQMRSVVKFTRDHGEVTVVDAIVKMTKRGFRLDGFPSYVYPPIELSQGTFLIVREAVLPLSDQEQTSLAPLFDHIFNALENEALLFAKAKGRGRAKHRDAYLAATYMLDPSYPQIAESLRMIAREENLLVADVSVQNIARARDRFVLYDFHVYMK